MTEIDPVNPYNERAVKIAMAMLDGSLDYFEGALELSALRFQVGLSDDDPDFQIFSVIESELDSLPIGTARKYWSEQALHKHGPEIKKAREWAKKVSLALKK